VLIEELHALSSRYATLDLDFADGSGLRLRRGQAWRWLRPRMATLGS
jgi:hypothetical protein